MARRTSRERAEAAVVVAQRNYESAVVAHGKHVKAVEDWYVRMTDAAAVLAHRQSDPALAPQSPLGGN